MEAGRTRHQKSAGVGKGRIPGQYPISKWCDTYKIRAPICKHPPVVESDKTGLRIPEAAGIAVTPISRGPCDELMKLAPEERDAGNVPG